VAPGDLDGPDLQCFLVDPEMDLAPDAPFGTAMLAGVPLAFALDLDPGAVDQQVQRPLGAAIGDVDGQGLLAADSVLKSGDTPELLTGDILTLSLQIYYAYNRNYVAFCKSSSPKNFSNKSIFFSPCPAQRHTIQTRLF
jgi:hypothetical protein